MSASSATRPLGRFDERVHARFAIVASIYCRFSFKLGMSGYFEIYAIRVVTGSDVVFNGGLPTSNQCIEVGRHTMLAHRTTACQAYI